MYIFGEFDFNLVATLTQPESRLYDTKRSDTLPTTPPTATATRTVSFVGSGGGHPPPPPPLITHGGGSEVHFRPLLSICELQHASAPPGLAPHPCPPHTPHCFSQHNPVPDGIPVEQFASGVTTVAKDTATAPKAQTVDRGRAHFPMLAQTTPVKITNDLFKVRNSAPS